MKGTRPKGPPPTASRPAASPRTVGGWTEPPARSPCGVRHHLVGTLLFVGDMLVVAGNALGRLADRLDPHPGERSP